MAHDTRVAYARTHARVFLLFGLLLLCAMVYGALFFVRMHAHEPVLRVVFFDVGQGDSIFIESPTGVQVVIDGGVDATVLRGLARELGFFDRTIDMVLATHEDKDHIGGLPALFTRYRVGTFVRTENQGESGSAQEIDRLPTERGSEIVFARRGMVFDLGGGATLSVLFPDRDPAGLESNTSSIVTRITYGDSDFLLTGDSPEGIEKYLVLLDAGVLESEVLKLGHHGSRTSSSEEFLNAVRPEYAVVSAGKDNRYGHPHSEVVDAVVSRNISLLNTAEKGPIVFESDGREVVLVE